VTTICIHQPAFLPWLGLIESMFACNVFVHLDDVQYEEGGFQNRNRIKTADGVEWLTVPVSKNLEDRIDRVTISEAYRPKKLLRMLEVAYGSAPHFKTVMPELAPIFMQGHPTRLIDVSLPLLDAISRMLACPCRFIRASDIRDDSSSRLGRLAGIYAATGADALYTGSGMGKYCTEQELRQHGIEPIWHRYETRHLVYRQNFARQGFQPFLSVVDLLFNCGCDFAADALQRSARRALAAHGKTQGTGINPIS
jgi:hypothetical protein